MTLTIEEAIARVPMWQNAVDIQISPLEGGITNHNYRVHVDGESFHLRIAGQNTEMLGIDRENGNAAHAHDLECCLASQNAIDCSVPMTANDEEVGTASLRSK